MVAKGRLKPGQMIAADTTTGELLLPEDIDNRLKSRQPYKQWLKANVRAPGVPAGTATASRRASPWPRTG